MNMYKMPKMLGFSCVLTTLVELHNPLYGQAATHICKFQTWLKVTDGDKQASILRFRISYCCNSSMLQAPQIVFTTLHFLCNLRISPIRMLHYTSLKVLPIKTLQLICPICKLRRKQSVVNLPQGPYSQHPIFIITFEWVQ